MIRCWVLKTSFDILDAAIDRYLPGYASGWVDFTREQRTTGSVVYHLTTQDLGDLGKLRLRKLSQDSTELCFEGPTYPEGGNLTPEQRSELESLPTAEAQRKRLLEMLKERDTRRKDLYQRRMERQEKAIALLFAGLQREGLLQGATEKRRLGAQGGTLDRVKEALELMQQDVPKTKACRRVGIDTRTFDRYVDQVISWENIE